MRPAVRIECEVGRIRAGRRPAAVGRILRDDRVDDASARRRGGEECGLGDRRAEGDLGDAGSRAGRGRTGIGDIEAGGRCRVAVVGARRDDEPLRALDPRRSEIARCQQRARGVKLVQRLRGGREDEQMAGRLLQGKAARMRASQRTEADGRGASRIGLAAGIGGEPNDPLPGGVEDVQGPGRVRGEARGRAQPESADVPMAEPAAAGMGPPGADDGHEIRRAGHLGEATPCRVVGEVDRVVRHGRQGRAAADGVVRRDEAHRRRALAVEDDELMGGRGEADAGGADEAEVARRDEIHERGVAKRGRGARWAWRPRSWAWRRRSSAPTRDARAR